MKVLYVAPERLLDPCYHDFIRAAGSAADTTIFDFTADARTQFEGVEVVIEHGGGFSTPEMWDAGAAVGVKLWQVTGTGIDYWDVASFLRRGTPLANMAGYAAIPMAEHALALMLVVAKQLIPSRRNLANRVFGEPLTTELFGKTLGLVGFGASGRELARRCRAFEMRIVATEVAEVPPAVRDELGVEVVGPDGLDWLLREADIVSLHVPLTSRTRGLLDARRLSLMRAGAVLVNVARGALVDEDALADGLRSGRLAGAGLDVYGEEPVDPDHPLLKLPNVVATPHNGVITYELSRRRAAAMTEQINRIRRGLSPLNQISAPP